MTLLVVTIMKVKRTMGKATFDMTSMGSDIVGDKWGDEAEAALDLSSSGSIIAIGAPWSDINGF